jgi:hypothetical protein
MDPSFHSTATGSGAKKNKGPQATGRGRKGVGTARHMAISFDGIVNFKLFPAQRQDCRSFFDVCKAWPWQTIKKVVADRGYS